MEIKENIPELRKRLQDPRKAVDTWYGRNIMRFFSIYLTRSFIRWNWTPNQATLLSLGVGLGGVFFLARGHWTAGLLGLNLWYLFDHVDGEIARYTGKSSLSGYFFDTVVNFFVQPLTFFAIGLGLQRPVFLTFGLLAAYGSLLLNLIPMCEDSILLQLFRKSSKLVAEPSVSQSGNARKGFLRRAFAWIHFAITYPSFLCGTTFALIVLCVPGLVPPQMLMQVVLGLNAVLLTVVWFFQLVYKVRFHILDQTVAHSMR